IVGTEDGNLHGVSTSYCIVSFTAGRRVSENITLDIIHLEMDEMVLGNFYLTARQGYMTDDRSGVELHLRHNWRIEFVTGHVVRIAQGEDSET
ncbi:hypothetical protein KI387_042828, partial [Taxus chinensis]